MNLLHIDASFQGDRSASRQISAAVAAAFAEANPGLTTIHRDLGATPLPHVDFVSLPGDHPLSAMAGPLNAENQAIRDESQKVLEEFLAADVIVIGAPMYNFSIPSQLKAWLDRIIIPGKTFGAGPNGLIGLMGDKTVVIALARGGAYGPDSPRASFEYAESYLKVVFQSLGAAPQFITAEDMRTPEQRETVMARALAEAKQAARGLQAA